MDADQFEGPAADDDARDGLLKARHAAQEWRTAYVAVTRARHRLYGTGAFWFTGKRPKQRSELYEILSDHPATVLASDSVEAGAAPELLRIDEGRQPAPDPTFPAGWEQALRSAASDENWASAEAAERGITDPYHAGMEQLEMVLDGLPTPPTESAADGDLRTSVTGLVTYASCPQRFRWSEVDRLPRRPTAAQQRGVAVHRRIELHHRGTLALEDLVDDFYDLGAADLPDPPTPGPAAPDPFQVFIDSRFAEPKPRFVEEPFELRLPGARVRGRVDAIYEPEPGTWEVVDFKSGRPRLDPSASVQLQAYAVAAADVGFAGNKPEHIEVTFAYLGGGLTIHSEQVTEPWLAAARSRLEGLTGAAAEGNYEATPSDACASCDFLRFCDEGRAFLEERNTGAAEGETDNREGDATADT